MIFDREEVGETSVILGERGTLVTHTYSTILDSIKITKYQNNNNNNNNNKKSSNILAISNGDSETKTKNPKKSKLVRQNLNI